MNAWNFGWSAIAAIGQVLGALFTAAAVWVALRPSFKRLRINLTYAGGKAETIVITNDSSHTITLVEFGAYLNRHRITIDHKIIINNIVKNFLSYLSMSFSVISDFSNKSALTCDYIHFGEYTEFETHPCHLPFLLNERDFLGVNVSFTCWPVFAVFNQVARYQPDVGIHIGERSNHVRSPLDLSIQPFQHICRGYLSIIHLFKRVELKGIFKPIFENLHCFRMPIITLIHQVFGIGTSAIKIRLQPNLLELGCKSNLILTRDSR